VKNSIFAAAIETKGQRTHTKSLGHSV